MLAKTLPKIDRFVYVFVATLVVLAVLLVVVFRSLFASVLVAYGPPLEKTQENTHINKDDLTKALEYVRQRQVVKLNLN